MLLYQRRYMIATTIFMERRDVAAYRSLDTFHFAHALKESQKLCMFLKCIVEALYPCQAALNLGSGSVAVNGVLVCLDSCYRWRL